MRTDFWDESREPTVCLVRPRFRGDDRLTETADYCAAARIGMCAVGAAATAPLGRSKDSKLPLCFTLHDAETQSRVPRSTARVR